MFKWLFKTIARFVIYAIAILLLFIAIFIVANILRFIPWTEWLGALIINISMSIAYSQYFYVIWGVVTFILASGLGQFIPPFSLIYLWKAEKAAEKVRMDKFESNGGNFGGMMDQVNQNVYSDGMDRINRGDPPGML